MSESTVQNVGAIDETLRATGSAQNHLRLMVMKIQELNNRGIKPVYYNPSFCEWDETVRNDYTIIRPDGSSVHMHHNGVVEKIHHTVNLYIGIAAKYNLKFINETGMPIPNDVISNEQ